MSNKEQSINLKDLTKMVSSELSSQGLKLDIKTVHHVVREVIETIKNGYINDNFAKLVIPGFGSFTNYWTKQKRNSNPQTGRIEMIAPKRKIKFKISTSLVKQAN